MVGVGERCGYSRDSSAGLLLQVGGGLNKGLALQGGFEDNGAAGQECGSGD